MKKAHAKPRSTYVDPPRDETAGRQDLAALLAEMNAESGPASPEEEAWARDLLGLGPHT